MLPHLPSDLLKSLASCDAAKLEECEFKGTVRLACPEDSLADESPSTFATLQNNHPPPFNKLPPIISSPDPISFAEEAVAYAIRTFPNGSAAGRDGLLPQHLKDLTSTPAGERGPTLLAALTAYFILVLTGGTTTSIHPYYFGTTLKALEKEGGRIRPIALGCTICRLVAKVASESMREAMVELLAPHQLR